MPTIKIELSQEQADRLMSAMEEVTGYPADIDSINTHITDHLKGIVSRGEKQKADRLAARPETFDVTVAAEMDGV